MNKIILLRRSSDHELLEILDDEITAISLQNKGRFNVVLQYDLTSL